MKLNLVKAIALFTTTLIAGGNAMAQGNAADNLKLLDSFSTQVFSQKDLANLEEFMHSDYIQHNPFVEQGIQGFRSFFSDWFKSIPDFRYTLKNIIANEEYVWVYGIYSGTHTNTWLGIEASNQEYTFDAVDIFRVSDGKLAEHWDVLDLKTLFEQLQPTK